jgi:hypothetical protein
MAEPRDDIRTIFLGRFNSFEAHVVIELLDDAGIFAYTKHDATENDHFQYSSNMESERGVIMVDASKHDEARKIIEEELPAHLKSIQESMEQLESGEAEA